VESPINLTGVLLMKNLTLALGAALLLAGFASTANAQYVYGSPYSTYYAPAVAPAYYGAPVVMGPRRAYYAPAPVYAAPVATAAYYAPAAPVYSSYYAPAVVAAPVYAQPVVVARYGRSIYGTRQVYYPSQPIANTWRAITP
jgi:hypothetical protein